MNKDNLLYLMGGLLVGFVFAYLLFDAMATRQTPRLTPGLKALIAQSGGAVQTESADARVDAQGQAPGDAQGQANPQAAMAEIQQLRAYVEKNPNDAEAVRKLADLNFDIQNWKRAQELYHHYLELKPNDPDVMTDLGITYRGVKDYDKALELFRQTQKLRPDHWQALYNEVVVLAFDLKKLDQAGTVLAKLEQMQPGNPDVKRLADAVARQRSAA